MSESKVRVVVAGVAGRMGQVLARVAVATPAVELVGATVRSGHAWAKQSLAEVLDGVTATVPVTDDLTGLLDGADALLDFTTPEYSVTNAALVAERGGVHVIGTTGFVDAQVDLLNQAAQHAAIVRSGNMSLGVNLIAGLARQVAAALGDGWDAEILEFHHKRKVDCPSGTALLLGEAVAAGRNTTLDQCADRGRDGHTGPRAEGNIGFAVLRGGDVVGEHEVIFAGAGERVALRHVATDRGIYAHGAVRAAVWAVGRAPGTYGMADVLGLNVEEQP